MEHATNAWTDHTFVFDGQGPHGTHVIAAELSWEQPLRWNNEAQEAGARRRVFCESPSDIFDDKPELVEPRYRLFNLIMATPNLDWLLLTKHPEHIPEQLRQMPVLKRDNVYDQLWPHHFPNVWLGVSAEDQKTADERIPALLTIPAMIHFVCFEPLRESLDIVRYLRHDAVACGCDTDVDWCPYRDWNIDWVIAGGECGPHARPMSPLWAKSLRDQCHEAGVPYFFTHHGEWLAYGSIGSVFAEHETNNWFACEMADVDGVHMVRMGAQRAGRLLDGCEHNDIPGNPVR